MDKNTGFGCNSLDFCLRPLTGKDVPECTENTAPGRPQSPSLHQEEMIEARGNHEGKQWERLKFCEHQQHKNIDDK